MSKKKHFKVFVFFLTSIVLFACSDKEPVNKVNVEKPKETISYEYAKKLQQEYIKTRAEPLKEFLIGQGTLKGEDVRDVWFDIDVLEQYIAYVKDQSKRKGYDGLGLRVYFGAYPKEGDHKDPGYTTVFFMPTHRSKVPKMNFVFQASDENSDDIDPLNFGSGGHPPKDLD